ncbi:MAG: chemotaxis protein CheB [Geminicoccaceae bacterium]
MAGIGASAGSLDAFKAFFAAMPTGSGMSFVLIQHLDPNYASSLVPIVAGYTAMPVHPAGDWAGSGLRHPVGCHPDDQGRYSSP